MGHPTSQPELKLIPGKEWYNRQELADAIGRHRQTIWRWERARKIVPDRLRPVGLNSTLMQAFYSKQTVEDTFAKLTRDVAGAGDVAGAA